MLNLEASQIIIQIIAFLAMLWIMKKFGWQPLLKVLESRRQTIQAEFASIEAKKQEADQLAANYEEKLKALEADARKKIQEAVAEGRKIALEIEEQALARSREILHKAKVEVDSDIAKAKMQLKKEMVDLVIATTEAILQEKLDEPGQKRLIEHFIEEAHLK